MKTKTTMIPEWAVYAIVSLVGLTVAELSQKISMRKAENISAEANNVVVWLIISCLGFVLGLLTDTLDFSLLSPTYLLYLTIIGFLYFCAGTLYYTSYKGISAAVGSTLVTVSIIVGTVLGIVFLREEFTLPKLIGMAMVIAAIALLNIQKQKLKIDRYALYAISGGVIFGVAYTVDKLLVLEFNPLTYTALFGPAIVLVSVILRPRTIYNDLFKKAKAGNFRQMLISGIAFALFNIATFYAYQSGGTVGSVDAINNTVVFWILGIEFLFMKERDQLIRKLLAGLLAFTAVLLIIYS